MNEKRLMKTEEEVRKRAKELLLLPKEDLLTQYMFQEQEKEIQELSILLHKKIRFINEMRKVK